MLYMDMVCERVREKERVELGGKERRRGRGSICEW